jgi:putative hydrolase of the HAD superfamily
MVDLPLDRIKILGFDADDTLWENEPYYRDTEKKFCDILKEYAPADEINEKLYSVEMGNMELYGYGTKAFVLSLIETAIIVSGGRVSAKEIESIITLGKFQIGMKISLLPGVTRVLGTLAEHYRLIVATKGDLLDQERKLKNSGISGYFHHIEIMTDKKEANYRKLLNHLDIAADEFLMIGNSLKSDVWPVVNLGGYAVHVPFHITWVHEELPHHTMSDKHYFRVETLSELIPLLGLNNGT